MGRYSLKELLASVRRLLECIFANRGREKEKIIRLNLCSKCKTGEYYYKLDPKSPYCPYVGACTQNGCPKFRSMKKRKGEGNKAFVCRKKSGNTK